MKKNTDAVYHCTCSANYDQWIEIPPVSVKTEWMTIHLFNAKGRKGEPHETKRIGVTKINQPFSPGNAKICVKKMDKDRDGINYENMIQATYK
jgi:hypothetical protein